MSDSILRLKDVMKKTGLSRSSIYFRMSKNNFPKSIKLGTKSVGWLETEIDAWIQTLIRQRPVSQAC